MKNFRSKERWFGAIALCLAIASPAAHAQSGLGVTQKNFQPPQNGIVTGPLGQDFYAGGNLVMSTRSAGVEFTRHMLSDFIYYAPSWAGGYARTLEAKLFDNISVKDFGAYGDGAHLTEDAAIIQTAVNYACAGPGGASPYGSGRAIYFPAGVYGVAYTNIPCNGVKMYGESNGDINSGIYDYRGTVLKVIPHYHGTVFHYGSTNADYGTGLDISEFGIDASAQTIADDGSLLPLSDPGNTGEELAGGLLFDVSWLQHPSFRELAITNPYNVFNVEGGANYYFQHIQINGLVNIGFNFWGTSVGCATGISGIASCNTRGDIFRLMGININSAPGYTSTCIARAGLSETVDVHSMTCESAGFGINAHCDATEGNNGMACPAFDEYFDFEAEDTTVPVQLSDTQSFQFHGGYLLGRGVATNHVMSVINTNFGATYTGDSRSSYQGETLIDGVRMGNAGNSVLYLGSSAVRVVNSAMFSGNLNDTNQTTGAPQVEINGAGSNTANPSHIIISNNTMCMAGGQQPTNAAGTAGWLQGGVWNVSGDYVTLTGNDMSLCTGGFNNLAKASNVRAVGNLGQSDL